MPPAKKDPFALTPTQVTYLARLRPLAQAVSLDARFAPEGIMSGFMQIFNPRTNESLAAGVNVETWLAGYTEAHSQLIALATAARDFLAAYEHAYVEGGPSHLISSEEHLRAVMDSILPPSGEISPEL